METLAKQLFGAYYEYKRLKEGVLWDFIENTFGAGAVDNHSFDPYDNSLELYNVAVGWAPSQDQLDKTAEFGFQILFVNYEDKTARRYRPPSDKWGKCSPKSGPSND